MRTALVTGAFLVPFAGQAHGATILGETFDPTGCTGNTTYIQTVDPGNRYRVPFDGVITSWSYQADAVAPATAVQLKIASVDPGADLTLDTANITIVAESAVETPTPGVVNTFQTRIPVSTGQRIGEWVDGGDSGCSRFDPTYTDHYFNDNVPSGTTHSFFREHFQQNISARLEPDADRDGFGDETQDQCPTDASTQGACPQPPTAECQGATVNKIDGTEADDTLTGTPAPDAIFGLGGNDEIDGVDGDDCLDGGDGDDILRGGADNDLELGSEGNDKVRGQGGKDKLKGGDGEDRLNGGEGKDRLAGGEGKDKLNGSAAKDKLKGNGGADDINAVDAKTDRVNCGGGDDKAVVDPIDRVSRNCETVREVDKS
jgi:hypothetical protein